LADPLAVQEVLRRRLSRSDATEPRAIATAYVNGRTYTVDPGNPWVKAVLVKELFTAVSSEQEIRAAAPNKNEFVDLDGHVTRPEIHDSHIHLWL
jgi:predicted amidohydrolase YtcJ